MKMQVIKLSDTAEIPKYAHDGDAGLDLFCAEKVTLEPGERMQINTGIAFAVPEGYVGLIWDKGGLSHKSGLKTLGGVLDAGYRGEVMVGMVNLGVEPYTFEVGHKVAQMLIQRVERPVIEESAELGETERGEGAFGSTGK